MTVAVTVALAGLFIVTGAGKVTGHATSLEMRDHHGVAVARWQQLGILELAGAAGVLLGLAVPPVGVAAAAGLAVIAIGGLAAHIRDGDPALRAAPAVLALILAIATAALQAAAA